MAGGVVQVTGNPGALLRPRPLLLGLAAITSAVLALEVLLTRLLSVLTWYSLAFLVIGMGLFGLTVGAVEVYLHPDRYGPERLAGSLADRAVELRLDERHEAMARCLEKLRWGDRELLAERFKEGATARSAAERVGLSVDAFYKALARIRRLLDECVTRTLASEGRS